MTVYPAPAFSGLPTNPTSVRLTPVLNDGTKYDVFGPRYENNLYVLDHTSNAPFASVTSYFYDLINEPVDGGIDLVRISPEPRIINVLGNTTWYDTFTLQSNVENAEIQTSGTIVFSSFYGNELNNYIIGSDLRDNVFGLDGNDAFEARSGQDTFDGGTGTDFLVLAGPRSAYTVTFRPVDGSYFVSSNFVSTSSYLIKNTEFIQFSDLGVWLDSTFPFTQLVADNKTMFGAISAAYQILQGGVPTVIGYDYLIRSNLDSNYGAGTGVTFNAENIFINITNALVQGNASAAQAFNTIAVGNTLQDKVFSIYKAIIPAAKQTLDGAAFLARPDALAFYAAAAAERGIASDNGAAIIALASMLKIAVDGKIGIGNPVGDLVAAAANGTATLQAFATTLRPIEAADGSAFDGDDAPDALPGFSPPPAFIGGMTITGADPWFG